ncbi:hypothetical protein HMI55_007067 [Coelomomyces lativittatus]|nr:hypothetical protein HMI55_007067 [Coelomomyces lativittatus]
MKRFDINILEDFTDAIAEFVLPRVEYEEIEGKKKKKNRNKVQVPPPTFVAINKIGSIEESGKGNMKPLVGKLATATATANSAPPSSNLPSKDTKELSDIKPKIDLVSTRDIPPLKKSSQPPYPPKVNSDKREFSEPLLQKSTSSIISKDNKLLENTSTQQTDPLQIYIQESDASKNTLTSNASKNTLTSNAPNNMKATSFISPLVNSDIKASYNSRNKCQTRKFT